MSGLSRMFAKQGLSPTVNIQDKGDEKALMQRIGQLIAEIFNDDLAVLDSERRKLVAWMRIRKGECLDAGGY